MTIIKDIREYQAQMSAVQRREFWDELQAGYCKLCGAPEPCYCSPHYDK